MKRILIIGLLTACAKNPSKMLIDKGTIITCPNSNKEILITKNKIYENSPVLKSMFKGREITTAGAMCGENKDSNDWLTHIIYNKDGISMTTDKTKFHTRKGWVP